MGNTEIFDRIARAYDNEQRIEIGKLCAEEVRRVIVGADTRGKVALDFGCGTGLIGMEFLEDFRSVLFLDSSEQMIEVTKEKLRQLQTERGQAICLDLEREEASEIRGDYIFIVQTLLHISDTTGILEKLFQLLNPGGHLIIIDFDKQPAITAENVHNGFEQEALKQMLEQVGFTEVVSRTFYQGEKLFMNMDASMFIMKGKK
ncbi:ubiquinone/menaquinone biosynthesis C-methylase UbiE [Lachnospiraceae bacterium PF1-21]|uniref:Class I SAM-dependent methyltransferase n=1 Tax=Ohessyouella blattaphilus TaxID=2949333 RepID=A0ABT1EJY4_9FIRM|nr:class I SAM-dependent methyltransferase [Ohessyouella blattaphilus]MCP1111008.1 class I SAM-dependent methyltransferase [Ohessyouella blattaphilus]MCR8564402.1 class I SAM-dependent methyltransferase [Ohessyouella blattaphilus]